MTVFFHGNFGLDRPRMAKLLELGLVNPALSDVDLAKPFGYGAPFAAIYRSWLHKTGFTRLRKPMSLTEFGEAIHSHDPGISQTETLWFMHHQLTDDPSRVEAWHFFIHKFRNENKEFTSDDLKRGLITQLSPHSMKHFGKSSKMIPIIARKLIDCYTSPLALGPLGLVREEAAGNYSFAERAIPPPFCDAAMLADRLRSNSKTIKG